MIAHGFVIFGLFFFCCRNNFLEDLETRKISELGGIRSQAPRFTSMFAIFSLASGCFTWNI
jgi:NADH-quinone oxidoreductase subunit M